MGWCRPWLSITGIVVTTRMRNPRPFSRRHSWLTMASDPPIVRNGMASRTVFPPGVAAGTKRLPARGVWLAVF